MILNSSYGNRVLVVVRDRESLLQGKGEQFTWYKTKMKGAIGPMRNSDTVLYNICKQTINQNYKHDRLYRLLYNENLYTKAYNNIYNKYNVTKDVDNESLGSFYKEEINNLIELLKDESYQPLPSRKIYTQKKDDKIKLGNQSFKDRILQEVCKMILEAIYEPIFSNSSHGFRPDRSCHTALKHIKKEYKDINWFIDINISNYYDNIDNHILIQIIRKKINDERFIRLMWKFLKAGYIEDWKYNKTFSDIPQGGVISPILANIYLNELDIYMEEYTLNFHKGKAENRIKYVRYSSDLLIGVTGSIEDCKQIKENIKEFFWNNLKIKLPESNAIIIPSNKQVKFLGYSVSVQKYNKVSKNGVVQLLIPKGTIEKIIVEKKMVKDINSKKWDMLHRKELLMFSDLEIIKIYNNEIRNIYNYYSLAKNIGVKMWQLKYVMEYSCLKTLAGKHKSTISKIKTKYSENGLFGVNYQTKKGIKRCNFYKGELISKNKENNDYL